VQRTVTREWGLLVPMKAQTHRLDDYTAVVFGFREGDSDTSDSFPVELKSRSGANLPLCSSSRYAEARGWVAEVARHLQLEIEDATTDHVVRLSAANVDLPLQHRLRLEHRTDVVVERPQTARSLVTTENGRVRVVIPAPRTHPLALVAVLTPIAIPIMVFVPFSQFFRQTRTPDPVAWFFLGFMILVLGVLPAWGALSAFRRSRRGHTTITISPAGIQIEERQAWKTRTLASFESSDIMDVDYSTNESVLEAMPMPEVGPRTQRVLVALKKFAKGRGITIKTRQGLTTFGKGLASDEIRYLHSIVRRAIARSSLSILAAVLTLL